MATEPTDELEATALQVLAATLISARGTAMLLTSQHWEGKHRQEIDFNDPGLQGARIYLQYRDKAPGAPQLQAIIKGWNLYIDRDDECGILVDCDASIARQVINEDGELPPQCDAMLIYDDDFGNFVFGDGSMLVGGRIVRKPSFVDVREMYGVEPALP